MSSSAGGFWVHLYSSPPRQGGTRREFRGNVFPETRGCPLTQRHLPTTLRKADDTFRAAKVQIILSHAKVFLLGEEKKMQGVGRTGCCIKRKHALQGWNAAHACRLGGSAFLPTEILTQVSQLFSLQLLVVDFVIFRRRFRSLTTFAAEWCALSAREGGKRWAAVPPPIFFPF